VRDAEVVQVGNAVGVQVNETLSIPSAIMIDIKQRGDLPCNQDQVR
jgi:hypothetical protein